MNDCNAQGRVLGVAGSANGCEMGQAIGSTDRQPTIAATIEIAADRHFDDALRAVIHGQRITRSGWNAAGQYVTAQYPDLNSKMTQPYLVLKNAQGGFVPWVPSQGDLFARDWAILPIQPA